MSNFFSQGGVQRCIGVLESCLDEQDWSLACLVCQALWNYCIDSNSITESIVDEECLCNLEGNEIQLKLHPLQLLLKFNFSIISTICFSFCSIWRYFGISAWIMQWSYSTTITVQRIVIGRSSSITWMWRKRVL